MRSCDQGYSGIETFTTLMNLPKPMTQRNYDTIVDLEMECVKSVAEETMLDAAGEIRQHVSNDDELFDTGVSCDGSWQKRGYSSLNINTY